MRPSVLIVAITLIVLGGAGAFLLGPDHAALRQSASANAKQVSPVETSPGTIAPMSALASTSTKGAGPDSKSKKKNRHPDSADAEANPGADQENPYINREVKARLEQVADDYAAQIQYPSFSQPIRDRDALQKYLPNRSFAAELPLDIEDETSPRIYLQTDKQQYFSGDTVNVMLSLSGLSGIHQVAVQARLIGQGQTLSAAVADAAGPQPTIYRMRLAGPDKIPGVGVGEYRVVARVDIDGKGYEIGTPVTYAASVSEVTYVGMAQVSGAYLTIPVNVTASKPGYYELTANLYGRKSGEPLVHVSAQTELQGATALMQLKAHVSSLKVGGDPGPYVLKDIVFTRMPSAPEFTTEYGRATQQAYEVNGYAFNEYDDAPYVDEEANTSLEFLQQLGSMK